MKLIKQPNAWSCGPTALAMLLDLSVPEIIESIGHDGGQLWFPNEPEPICYRGFHVQELVDCAFNFGWALTEIQARPATLTNRNPDGVEIFEDRWTDRLNGYLLGHSGLILMQNNAAQAHMAAWDSDRVYDPKIPSTYLFWSEQECAIESFFLLSRIKS